MLDRVADTEIDRVLKQAAADGHITEPQVAREVALQLPSGHALFLGNSMPIRDIDAFADFSVAAQEVMNSPWWPSLASSPSIFTPL